MTYLATLESLRQHPVPDWYHDAKLGIFVHWTPSSIPAFAPPTGKLPDVVKKHGWNYWFRHNPYAEWYANTLKITGSPTQEYHASRFGKDFPYTKFAEMFNTEVVNWQPSVWADWFAGLGARYVVMVTKHHDGFTLWQSRHPNPHLPTQQARRDLVGDLTDAVRARGMKMGLYYSGGLDWTFSSAPIRGAMDMLNSIPNTPDYATYADAQVRELIDRYQPSVLWGDIGYPKKSRIYDLLAHYYNTIPDSVVNDRWNPTQFPTFFNLPGIRQGMDWLTSRLIGGSSVAPSGHWDFRTPEYTSYPEAKPFKWEATRGIGYSFAYNQAETRADMLTGRDLIHSFVDIVSKNGNLLINVGPKADGTIPESQRKPLDELGAWLKINGEALFDTRPWTTAEYTAPNQITMRFTQKEDALYVIVLAQPREPLYLPLHAAPGMTLVTLLGQDAPLAWEQQGAVMTITLPKALPDAPAYSFKISPKPAFVATAAQTH
jgi:alpha-L-fucosidase